MFYEFYGLSGVQLVLLNLTPGILKSYIKPLDNTIDYKRALELKSELQTLKYNLSCLNVNYASPEGRKLKRQLSKHEQGERILADNELEQIKSRLAEIPETVIGSKLYGRPLSPEECTILNELRKKTGVIDRYLKCIEDRIFADRRVYGVKLSYAVNMSSNYIMNILSSEIKNSNKATLPNLYKRYKTDIEFVKGLNEVEVRQDLADEELPIEIGNTELVKVKSCILDASNNNEAFKKNTNMNLLLTIYNQCKIFNDESFYNEIFGLNLTKEEYVKIFDNLMNCGIIGLNFEASKLFLQVASCLTYSKENDLYLAEDNSLFTVTRYLERIIDSYELNTGDKYE